MGRPLSAQTAGYPFQTSWFRTTFAPWHPDLVSMFNDLAEAMASDARFIDVRGFASEEVHSGIPEALRPIEP
jgi:hypothetical protein